MHPSKQIAVICVSMPLVGLLSCVPAAQPTATTGPQGSTDLSVTASLDAPAVVEGDGATLTAEATGGSEPYAYRWDQNDGPTDIELDEVTSASLSVDTFDVAGRYVFRVVVTDSRGFESVDFVIVDVVVGVQVEIATEDVEYFEGMTATLTATGTGGAPPYGYAWSQVDGPAEPALRGASSLTLAVGPFSVAGAYTFEVVATDATGQTASTQAAIEVSSAIDANVPTLVTVGEPATLSVEPLTPVEGLGFLWEVTEGTATIDDPTAATTDLTTMLDETVVVQLTVTIPTDDGDTVSTISDFSITSIAPGDPQVLVETNLGSFTIELAADEAPMHTENFLTYVNEQFYEGLLIHRVACTPDPEGGPCEPFVIQGGGYERVDGELVLREPTRPPVPSEAGNGLSNGTIYSVSLALTGGDPNSGQTQFFINLKDNSFLNESGFTVFGMVVEGTDVVDQIAATETTDSPFLPGEVSLPVEDVIIEQMTRITP